MPKTTNYDLEKPDMNSTADIEVLNNNFDKIDTELFNKVDKVAGKSLSSNDFTNDLKEKLEGLQNFDSSEIDNHMENATKHITAVERASWNNKVDKVSGKVLSTNDYTNVDKAKVANTMSVDELKIRLIMGVV